MKSRKPHKRKAICYPRYPGYWVGGKMSGGCACNCSYCETGGHCRNTEKGCRVTKPRMGPKTGK